MSPRTGCWLLRTRSLGTGLGKSPMWMVIAGECTTCSDSFMSEAKIGETSSNERPSNNRLQRTARCAARR